VWSAVPWREEALRAEMPLGGYECVRGMQSVVAALSSPFVGFARALVQCPSHLCSGDDVDLYAAVAGALKFHRYSPPTSSSDSTFNQHTFIPSKI
jgi:hypothetical protein